MVLTVEFRRKAMDILASREHSAKELKDKLLRKFGENQELDHVIAQLQEDGLQSDQRFAEAFCRQRIHSGYGPMRIRMELVQRGVDQELAEAFFQTNSPDWYSLCEQIRLKKFGDWNKKGSGSTQDPVQRKQQQKDKARQQRFLYSRGFPAAIINDILT